MNEPLKAAQPPLFSNIHAATIVTAVRDYPNAAGLLVHIPSQRTLVAASYVNGVIGRWVIESPASVRQMGQRYTQLAVSGLHYVCLTMRTDTLVPLDPETTH